MLRQSQQIKLYQKLSPQQIRLMKLLQVPTSNLEERIKDELESNPALDINVDYNANNDQEKEDYRYEQDSENNQEDSYSSSDDSIDLSSYLQSEYESDNGYYYNNDDEEQDRSVPIKIENTFHDHLTSQLNLLTLSETAYAIAEQIIGSIDDDGYLRREIASITDDLAFKQNIYTSDEEVIKVLKTVQNFDPPGIGARDLQECLLLQLKKSEPTASGNLAIKIIKDHFEEFSKRHYDKLKLKLKVDDDAIKEAVSIIIKLTPKPGAAFNTTSQQSFYIIPDFFVRNNNGNLELTLNSKNAPELNISENYREMLESYQKNKKKSKREKEAVLFIKQKIDAAKWFIDAIKQRQHTLLITMDAILQFQKDFFKSGDETTLRPMILKDVASVTQMDISTVSRVANSKYVQTEYGTYPLKFFFSESTTTESGEEISTREVKMALSEIVEHESKSKPHSDEALTQLLIEKGYQVARRTVAKYREQLNIPVARLRKEV